MNSPKDIRTMNNLKAHVAQLGYKVVFAFDGKFYWIELRDSNYVCFAKASFINAGHIKVAIRYIKDVAWRWYSDGITSAE